MIVHPKQILWPTDLSELSLRAGKYARGLCQLFSAELHILHVITPPLNPDVTLLLPSDVPLQISEPELRGAALRSLQNLVERHLEKVTPVVTEVRFGNPWPVICDYAKQSQVELIVVSTHGRTGLGHAIIGSTAERIVQHAPCPVLAVKAHERGFLKE
jgi:universal stress protein A